MAGASPAAGLYSTVFTFSMILTTAIPLTTSPKTTCLPSRCGHDVVVMKNWEPLVFGPELAIDSSPGRECFLRKFSSCILPP